MNLKGRDFLTLLDYSGDEVDYLLELAAELKEKKRRGERGDLLVGKNIALLFEKSSTRTRCAFVVAARDEGGYPEFLGKNDIQLGKKETVADTARVLSRLFDGIQFRGFAHSTVEELGRWADVPVWNGLTDSYHPTQVLADLLTVKEEFGRLEGINFVYTGDGRNNVACSLMVGCALMGVNFRIAAPESLWPEKEFVSRCRELAGDKKGEILLVSDPGEAVKGADVIYTDVWVSMGEEEKFAERVQLLRPYQVNSELVTAAGNDELIFLHCLPAFHNSDTEYGQKIYNQHGIEEMEVTDQVFESDFSRVFAQAENRLHTIKAVMVATLGDAES